MLQLIMKTKLGLLLIIWMPLVAFQNSKSATNYSIVGKWQGNEVIIGKDGNQKKVYNAPFHVIFENNRDYNFRLLNEEHQSDFDRYLGDNNIKLRKYNLKSTNQSNVFYLNLFTSKMLHNVRNAKVVFHNNDKITITVQIANGTKHPVKLTRVL